MSAFVRRGNMKDKTVLICGAGISGPTLAFWLQAAGFRPTLVENAFALRTGGYVIDFWGLGYDIADRLGLAVTSSALAITCASCRSSTTEASVWLVLGPGFSEN